MQFPIADSFTDSLGRLTGDEQKQVKTTAFDLQLNPANPGHHFHKLDRARDKNFWSVRVGSDIRLIVHGNDSSLLLCYGIPPEWLPDVKQATEDSLLSLADHLPAEAAEALLELATGGKPRVPAPATKNPFDHPDAQRRFRVMGNLEALQQALAYPWESMIATLTDRRTAHRMNRT